MWRLKVNCGAKISWFQTTLGCARNCVDYMRSLPKVMTRKGLSEKGLAPKLGDFARKKGEGCKYH
jgi:hypothetical protein